MVAADLRRRRGGVGDLESGAAAFGGRGMEMDDQAGVRVALRGDGGIELAGIEGVHSTATALNRCGRLWRRP